jgi:large subunit ribosomal protein L21
MYAIVDIDGKQHKVSKDQTIYVNRLQGEQGESVKLDNVLLVNNDGSVSVGTPNVKGAAVNAKILEHLQGDKVVVFKKKRRKGYRLKKGHRSALTKLQIETINV